MWRWSWRVILREGGGRVVDNMVDCNRVGDQGGGGQIEVDVQVDGRIHGHDRYLNRDRTVDRGDDRSVGFRDRCLNDNRFQYRIRGYRRYLNHVHNL